MAQTTLLRGALALTGEALAFDRQPRDVLVDAGRIAAIEPAGRIDAANADAVVDLSRRLLVPGLVNGHQHSAEHFQRGRVENLPLELWLQLVRPPQPVPLTPRQVYLRTMIGAIESLRTGCTTLVDDFPQAAGIDRAAIDAVLQAYDDAGLRALVGFGMMDRAIVDSLPFVDELVPADLAARLRAAPRTSAAEFETLMRTLARERHPRSRRVAVLASASAPQRCSEAFLRRIRALADELALPVITHVQETRLQVVTSAVFNGATIVEYLDRIGFLKPATSLIHAVWLSPGEIALLAASGATAQHNPWSNLLLGSGVQPTRELLDAGVNVSLGSDGSCSTMTTSMLNVVGSAAAVSKLRGNEPGRWLTAHEALHAGTLAGGRALGFGDALGSLAVGALADLVAYRLDTVTFAPLNDPVRQLVYAERGAGLDFAMVDGAVVVADGRLTRVDEAAIVAEVEVEFRGLADRFRVAERSAAPVLTAVEAIYRRSLAVPIAPATLPAKIV
ncbi:MAG TPA: amidohydrolase family protein [Caldimonas sp.]|jgi:guanine deaminase|nr:amidohydrolase family protein [Caldimonas sp.]HEV7576320.1 amidohydrolase family protein [Caldimonas sp.]